MGGKQSKKRDQLETLAIENDRLMRHAKRIEAILENAVRIVGPIKDGWDDRDDNKREWNCTDIWDLRNRALQEGAIGLKNVVIVAEHRQLLQITRNDLVACNGDPVWPDSSDSYSSSSSTYSDY